MRSFVRWDLLSWSWVATTTI